jgi:uncharacterized protein YciI
MPYFALFYDVVDDFASRRSPFRPNHLRHVQEAHDRGELILAGAFANPCDRALLVFRGEDRRIAEAFAERDPYVVQGLVSRWHVRDWTQVIATEQGEHAPVMRRTSGSAASG